MEKFTEKNYFSYSLFKSLLKKNIPIQTFSFISLSNYKACFEIFKEIKDRLLLAKKFFKYPNNKIIFEIFFKNQIYFYNEKLPKNFFEREKIFSTFFQNYKFPFDVFQNFFSLSKANFQKKEKIFFEKKFKFVLKYRKRLFYFYRNSQQIFSKYFCFKKSNLKKPKKSNTGKEKKNKEKLLLFSFLKLRIKKEKKLKKNLIILEEYEKNIRKFFFVLKNLQSKNFSEKEFEFRLSRIMNLFIKTFESNSFSKNYLTLKNFNYTFFFSNQENQTFFEKNFRENFFIKDIFPLNFEFFEQIFYYPETFFALLDQKTYFLRNSFKKKKKKQIDFYEKKLEEKKGKTIYPLFKKKKNIPSNFFLKFLFKNFDFLEIIKKKICIRNRFELNFDSSSFPLFWFLIFLSSSIFSQKLFGLFFRKFSEFQFLVFWATGNFILIKNFKNFGFGWIIHFFFLKKYFRKKNYLKLKKFFNVIFNNGILFDYISFKKKKIRNLKCFLRKENRTTVFSYCLKITQTFTTKSFKNNFEWIVKNFVKKTNSFKNSFFFHQEQKICFSLAFSFGFLSLGLKNEIFFFLTIIEGIRNKKIKNLIGFCMIFFSFIGKKSKKTFLSLIFNFISNFSIQKKKKKERFVMFLNNNYTKPTKKKEISEFNNQSIIEISKTFIEKKTRIQICLNGFALMFFGNLSQFQFLIDIFHFLLLNQDIEIQEIILNSMGSSFFLKPQENFFKIFFQFSFCKNLRLVKNSIFLLGINTIGKNNQKISLFLKLLIEFYIRERHEFFSPLIKNSKKKIKNLNSNLKNIIFISRIAQSLNFVPEGGKKISFSLFSGKIDFDFLILILPLILSPQNSEPQGFLILYLINYFLALENSKTNKWILDANFRIKTINLKKKDKNRNRKIHGKIIFSKII